MKRVAFYARFSDADLQNARSIDDQIAMGRIYADRHGWSIVKIYSDYSVSGSTVHRRLDYAQMISDAEKEIFDIILAEDADRLSRGEGDLPILRRNMEFINIEIHTCSDGHITKMHAGLKGLMSSMFLDNLALHVRRGLAGVVREGRHPGGNSYGYKPIAGKPGELEIVPEQAAVLRRIFSRYVEGAMPRTIAIELNKDNIPPPRGAYWRGSTIGGSVRQMTGLLQNELYVGVIVWNKHRKVRNPANGKRVDRPNPKSMWQTAPAPHLRIVDETTFRAAQEIRARRGHIDHRQRIAPKRFLSGLLHCGCCGAGMSIKDRNLNYTRIVCSQMKEAGACTNRRSYPLEEIERRVVERLRENLGSREAIAYFVRCYADARQKAASSSASRRDKIESRLGVVTREIDRTVDLVIRQVIADGEASKRLTDLRAEKGRLAAELATITAPKIIALHPAAVEAYLRGIERLDVLLNADLAAGDDGAAKTVRELIERVTVEVAPPGIEPVLRLEGNLASIIAKMDAPPEKAGGLTLPGTRHRRTPRPA
jgi:DNA invertase Pin-like site-specific DNA recombinase